jgi:hypothetical protein
MTVCGYTPAQIDEMAFSDVWTLFEYWSENPPAHEILKAVYQVEKKKPAATAAINSNDPSGIGGMIAAFPSGFVKAG